MSALALALVLVPAAAGSAAFAIRRDAARRALLVGTAALHAAMTAAAWTLPPASSADGWLSLDALGLLFLTITSALFLAAAAYSVGYLRRERRGERSDFEEGVLFTNAPEAVFTGCLLLFLATMTLVTESQHFGLLWVAIEATTLASAPLIYFHRHHRSLEATWKYLMLCSVGIALSLLGNFFLAVAASGDGGTGIPMVLGDLLARAGRLHPEWLKAAFLFVLVGYGTKMGLAPLHTWLPDAHSEAPSAVSALLSGALLNCAALGILRALQVCSAAGQAAFCQDLLVGFGLLSMGLATVFLVGQPDYKRMLAYSSVEHMGIVALGVGLGGAGAFGAILHAVNHSLAKAMLFLLSGNILAAYNSKSTSDVRGLLRVLPLSGALWFAGFLAITGSPPFGPFLSEFTILRAAIDDRRAGVAAVYLVLLAIAFVGMAAAVLGMTQGPPRAALAGQASGRPVREALLAVAPPAALGALVLLLGLHVPPALRSAIAAAARAIGAP
jgi:hydrogenase-4 component F